MIFDLLGYPTKSEIEKLTEGNVEYEAPKKKPNTEAFD